MGIYRHWLEIPRAVADFRARYKIPDDVHINAEKPKGGDGCIKEEGFDKSFTNHIMKCV